MPIQEYRCPNPKHGKFQVMLRIEDDVPEFEYCPKCGELSLWVPPTVSFPGGPTTGARPPILREDNDA